MTGRLAGILLWAAAGAAVPMSGAAETLGRALADAYENSGLLEQNRALLRAADEDVAQTVSRLRPIVDWSADVTHTASRRRAGTPVTIESHSTDLNLGLSASLLLYDFGATDLQIEAAKENVLATRQALVGVEQQVLLRAVEAFMNVRRTSEVVALRRNNLNLIREQLRAARDRFEVGEVTRTDVSQAEARLAAAQSGLAAAEGDLARAKEEFTAAVGRRPGGLVPPRRMPDIGGSVEDAKARAMQRHPDMRRARRDVTVAELNVRVAEAARRPTINLTGRIGAGEELGGSDFSRTGSIGIQATGPIYRGGRLSSLTRQAMARRDAARGSLHDTRLRIARNVGNAYASLRATRAGIEASREAVRAARVAFRGVREEANLGARTTLDVLDAEQELLNARADLISAEADLYIAAYAVLAATGQLTARDLNLDVQLYDAAAYYNLVKDAPLPSSEQGRKLDRVLRALGKQ
ncbi:TolC family outer membrane protein [Roseovarius salinarum]|uniref:TolC family outer membrane protein n=1 Tax=Roseovarius salinarum TaxID=1981892 RepID=UPI000C336D20|nr:TolC family outer membrane protein [Roseovarius salinarum]